MEKNTLKLLCSRTPMSGPLVSTTAPSNLVAAGLEVSVGLDELPSDGHCVTSLGNSVVASLVPVPTGSSVLT